MNVQSLYKFDNEKWTKYLTIIFIMNIVKHDTTTFTFTAWPFFSKSIIHVWIFRFEFAFYHWMNWPSIARQPYVSSDWTKHLGQFVSLEAESARSMFKFNVTDLHKILSKWYTNPLPTYQYKLYNFIGSNI